MINESLIIQKEIHAALNAVGTSYKNDAPADAKFPYLVFRLGSATDDGEHTLIYPLTVDGWDKSESSVKLSNLMFNSNERLKKIMYNEDISFSVYLDTKNSIDEKDTSFKHIIYNYSIRVIY